MECGEDGGTEVFGADGAFADPHRGFVRGSVGHSSGNSGPGEHGGVAIGPVIASDGGRTAADFGSSSEFANENDERGVQQSSIFQILDQGRDSGVGAWQSPAESVPAVVKDADSGIAVHVPGFDADEFFMGSESHPGNDVDETDAGFNQSSCHQQILSEGVSSVAIPQLW